MKLVIHMTRPQEIPLEAFPQVVEAVAICAKEYGGAVILDGLRSVGIQSPHGPRTNFSLHRDLSGAPFNPKDHVYDLVHYGLEPGFGVCWVAALLWLGENVFPDGRLLFWCDDSGILEEGKAMFLRVFPPPSPILSSPPPP